MNRHFKKRSILIVAVFVIAIVGLAAVYHWQQIPDDVIAFTSTREGQPAIYLVTPDGSYLRRLTPYQCCPASILRFLNKIFPGIRARIPVISDKLPFWSTDGQYIAYIDFYDNYNVMSKNGTNRQSIPADINRLMGWSFDSSSIAYRAIGGDSGFSYFTLYTYDGDQIEQIPYEFEEHWPYLSPDLKRIAFWATGEIINEQIPRFHVCLTTLDNGEITCSTIRAVGEPVWAPNNQAIAFSCRDLVYALCVMNVNNYQTKKIALPPEVARVGSIVWSPDSEKLAFEGEIWQSPEVSTSDLYIVDSDLYIVDSDGSALTRLTNHPESDSEPSWSPDSSKVVFTSARSGNLDLYIINADGTDLIRLTYDEGYDSQPSWRPVR